MNVCQILQCAANRTPDRVQYSFLDRQGEIVDQLSCQQLYRQSLRLARVLRQRLDRRQALVLLMLPANDFVVAFWACLLADIRPVPVSTQRGQTLDDVCHDLARQGIDTVLVDDGRCLSPDSGIRFYSMSVLMHESVSSDEDLLISLNDQATAFIQFSSGSTRRPKGIEISHANILHNLRCIHEAFDITTSDSGLCWLPLHHDMGLIGHVLQPVYSGINNYFMRPADFIARPRNWLRFISRYKATISGAPAFAYRLCCHSERNRYGNSSDISHRSNDLSLWRVAYCGSEIIDADVLLDFAAREAGNHFKKSAFFPCYGLAESTLFVSGRAGIRHYAGKDLVSVGRPADDVCIVDIDTGQVCSAGESGEILIRSDSVARQYYRDASDTDMTFQCSVVGKQGRYMRTGDLGLIDDDELYISGRVKNIIKVRGQKYQAENLESGIMLSAAKHGIRRCVIVPIMVDGVENFAVVVEANTSQPSDLISCVSMSIFDQAGLSPSCIFHVRNNKIPLTSSGKIRRSAMPALLEDLASASPRSNPQ